MARKIGVGVIGCGGAARIGHLRWYALNPDVELLAVADIDEARAASCAKDFGAEYCFTDYMDLLNLARLDAVSICTPPWLHSEQTVAAAEHGKHVLCEKPMSRTLKECDEMIEACAKSGVFLMIGFMKRFNPGFQLIKENLKEGKMEKPFHMDAHWKMYIPPEVKEWRLWDERTGGGIFQDHGSHYIDLFRWWTGDEVQHVSAETLKFEENRKQEDHAVVLLRFTRGAFGVIETSKDTLVDGMQEFGWIHAKGGSMYFDSPPWDSTDLPVLRVLSPSVYGTGGWSDINLQSDKQKYSTYMFKREIDHFIRCVLNDEPPAITGTDGRASVEVVIASYRSNERCQKVRLPLTD